MSSLCVFQVNNVLKHLCDAYCFADSASACSVQLAKLLAAQKILDKVEKDGYVVLPDYKRVKPVDPNLDPIYLLEYFCRGSGLDLPSYLQSKIKQGGKTVYSYQCFWRDRVTQGELLEICIFVLSGVQFTYSDALSFAKVNR